MASIVASSKLILSLGVNLVLEKLKTPKRSFSTLHM